MNKANGEDLEALRNSGLFNEKWYLEQYPDVKMLGMDPLDHYLWVGARMGRNPSRSFSTLRYLERNADVASAQVNPLFHYVKWGKEEGRGNPESKDSEDLNISTFHVSRSYNFFNDDDYEKILKEYVSGIQFNCNNIAFYTAITSRYDNISYHEYAINNSDYYLFSDEGESKYIFQGKKAPYFEEDSVRAARFVKTHPHMLLPNYRVAVWTDGNILIRKNLSSLIDDFENSTLPVAAVPHPLRTSVYEEALECIKRGKDDPSIIEAQMNRYRAEGFDCTDLVESNFMMFRLDHPLLAPVLNEWWAEIERGSRRDQLSFNYAMHKVGASWFPLTERPNSVRNHPALALFHHGSNHCSYSPATLPIAQSNSSYADALEQRIERHRHRTADVIVCVHNALDSVILCLESIADNRNSEKHRIVIVNDGSDEQTSAWLEKFAANHANTLLIRHIQAGGYTKAANAGLRVMNADMAILLNSDTIVAGRWIEKLLDAAYSNPGVGIVGPLSSAASHQSIPDHKSTANQTAVNDLPDGYTVADMNRWCEEHSSADFIPRVPLVHGFCFAVTSDLIQKVGYFDEENFPSGYGEENDYCFRAVDAGFSLAIATHTYVYHEKSQSYQGDRRVALMKAGNMKIRELHGTERVLRAVRSMQANPTLDHLRKAAAALF